MEKVMDKVVKDHKIKLILIDDSETDLKILEYFCQKGNFEYKCFLNPHEALQYVSSHNEAFLMVTDISMQSEVSGFDILKYLKERSYCSNVIFVSGHQDVDYPIKAMRMGAMDYLTKPLSYDVFEARILKAFDVIGTKQELSTLKNQISSGSSFESFVGQSKSIQNIFSLITKISRFDSTVLISGESGVGKERVAHAIHDGSKRADQEFIPVNCASLPENLIESELFGYVKGAFTGADKDTLGLFRAANQGTLFLDEVGEIPLHLQAKLLRVIQEKEVRPVGANKSHKIDTRIICATHRNLEELVKEGRFREDLYFRLNVIPIHIPPLRDRREDLKLLINYFLNKLNDRWGSQKVINSDCWEYLENYPFPGNVRELENILERAYILSAGNVIQKDDLEIRKINSTEERLFNLGETLPSLREIELSYIKEILKRTPTKEEAARVLKIGRKTLYRKESELDLIDSEAPSEDLDIAIQH